MENIAPTYHPTLRTDHLQTVLGCPRLITRPRSNKQILTNLKIYWIVRASYKRKIYMTCPYYSSSHFDKVKEGLTLS